MFRSAIPSLFVDINRTKVEALQIPIQDVFTTLNVYMGGLYVNQFNQFGLIWQVQVEAAPQFRTTADMLKQFQVRTSQAQMVPMGSIAAIRRFDRAPVGDALQHVRLGLGQWALRPRSQHGDDRSTPSPRSPKRWASPSSGRR